MPGFKKYGAVPISNAICVDPRTYRILDVRISRYVKPMSNKLQEREWDLSLHIADILK